LKFHQNSLITNLPIKQKLLALSLFGLWKFAENELVPLIFPMIIAITVQIL